MLGHESPVLTLSTYAGLFEDDLDALGDTMSAAFQATSFEPSGTSASTDSDTPANVTAIGSARAWAAG